MRGNQFIVSQFDLLGSRDKPMGYLGRSASRFSEESGWAARVD